MITSSGFVELPLGQASYHFKYYWGSYASNYYTPVNSWLYLSLVFTKSHFYIFVDGILTDIFKLNGENDVTLNSEWGPNLYFDEFKISNIARNITEKHCLLKEQCFIPPYEHQEDENTISLFHINENSGSEVFATNGETINL